MADESPLPSFTDSDVLARLRDAAARGLTHTRQAGNDLFKYGWDIQSVNELLKECSEDELHCHELSDHYPEHNDYVVILKIDLEGERHPFYVKVALHLPNLESGELLSFHEWGLRR